MQFYKIIVNKKCALEVNYLTNYLFNYVSRLFISYQRRTPSNSENKSVSFWQRRPKGCQYKITLLHLTINRKERLIRDNRLFRGLFSCTRVPRLGPRLQIWFGSLWKLSFMTLAWIILVLLHNIILKLRVWCTYNVLIYLCT